MALNPIISKEKRQKRGALENAALGMGLAQSVAGIANSTGNLLKQNTKMPLENALSSLVKDPEFKAPGSSVWSPMKYKLGMTR
jgi:hypothetical protein